jgi:Uma2 family endonuclease
VWYASGMQHAERRRHTEDEYVELEHRSETKNALVDGEIHAMSGAKPRHNRIAGNVLVALDVRLRTRESPCEVFNSDQRIRSEATGMNTYADAVVACGPRFDAKYREALVNPTVIVEVLSKSTEDYDHGAKLAHYRTIPSFVEYVLVSQRTRQVEHFRRIEPGEWLLKLLERDEAVLELASLACSIPLRELYARTDGLPGDEDPSG